MSKTFSFTMALTNGAFSTLVEALKEDSKDVKMLLVRPDGTGTLTTKDVTLNFGFVAAPDKGTLTVDFISANSFLAKAASSDTIESHIKQLLNTFLP